MSLYQLHGLVIDSPIELPALLAGEGATASLRVSLRPEMPRIGLPSGEVVARLAQGDSAYSIIRADSGVYCCYAGLGDVHFALDARVQIGVGAADPETAAALFCGSALAAWLVAQSQLVLHACCVAWEDFGLAIVGSSHSGKTTLAAQCVLAGATLVSDDVLRVTINEGVASWHMGVRWLRLRSGASELARAWPGPCYLSQRDGRHVAIAGDLHPVATDALHALVFPKLNQSSTVAVKPLSQQETLRRLLSAPRVRGLDSPSLLRTQFRLMADLARTVPGCEVAMPAGPPFAMEDAITLKQSLAAVIEPAGGE